MAAERRLRKFNGQRLANSAWAFATVNYRDKMPFTALVLAAEWQLSAFSFSYLQMALSC